LATGSAETRRVFQDRANRRQYLCRAIFHMWTAPSSQGVLQYFDQIARVHMSGLFVRSHMNAGQDGLCDKSSKQNRDLIEGHWNMRISLVVDRLITPSARYLASSGISSARLQLSCSPCLADL
jgi:hypothetical protein